MQCMKHKRKPMPMFDVKQESLANAKVGYIQARNSGACMKAPSEEIYSKSTQGT